MKILYLEDNPLDADLTRRELVRQAPDYEIDIVPTLRDARLHLAQSTAYDLVLLDLRVPDGSGLDLLGELRDRESQPAVVVLTGSGDEEAAVAALKAGADDYLIKREDYLARLPQALQAALEHSRAEAARQARPLRVLYAEHNAADIDLTRRHLARHAPHIHLDVVYFADDVLRRMPATSPGPCPCDVLLLDFRLPRSDALEVLKILRQDRGLDLPIVLVTGHGDEDVALQAWRLGATDYLVKNAGYLYKLPVIVENAFHRVQLAREQATLRESEESFRLLFESNPHPMWVYDLETLAILEVNDAAVEHYGYSHRAFLSMRLTDMLPAEDVPRLLEVVRRERPALQHSGEWRHRLNDGRIIDVEITSHTLVFAGHPAVLVVAQDITERKRSAEALHASEEKYRQIVEGAQEGIWIIDAENRTAFANGRMAEMLGYSVDEMLGQPLYAFMDDEAKTLAEINVRRRQEGIREQHEFIFQRKDGTRLWAFLSTNPLLDRDGRYRGAQAMVTDISDLKLAQEAEREQRILAEALASTASTLISALNLDAVMGTILEGVARVVPHAAANIMLIEGDVARPAYWRGYRPERMPPTRDICVAVSAVPSLRQMVETGSPFLAADTDQYPDWVQQPLSDWVKSYIAAPIRSHDNVIGFLNLDSGTPGFFNAVHAQRLQAFADQASIAIEHAQLYEEIRRHAAELEQRVDERTDQLNQTLKRLEAILDSSDDIIILCSPDGTISQVNPAFSRTLACDPDEALSQPLEKLVLPEDTPLLAQAFQKLTDALQPQRLEVTVHCRGRATFDADVVLSPIVEPDTGITGVVCSVRDVTQRKQLETQLRQMLEHEMELGELKSRYVSMAAHDLRNPLAVIQSSIGLIQHYGDRMDAEKRTERYARIQTNIRVMVDMLDDILTLGRVESGRHSVEPVPLDVGTFCRSLVMEIEQAAATPHVINFSSRGDCRAALLDARLLRHILGNLLTNAIKYSPAGQPVTFTIDCEPDRTTFRVQDRGIGIPSDDQERLFESFHRARNVQDIPGTGLGLAIVKQSVELHQGTITFESAEGRGTTFTVIIPRPLPAGTATG